MTKGMCIAYEVADGLYLNVTNRCSNRCDFCIRNNGDGAYGSDSLWLEREPTVSEILEVVFSRDLTRYSEIVFCGYGEPSYRLSDAAEIARAIKGKYPDIKIRINTNGHSDLIHSRDTSEDYKGAFDTVSISLNTPTPEHYDRLCHPRFENSHAALLLFAQRVKKYVPNVILSVVRQTLTDEELSRCEMIAECAGVTLKVREYISD